MSSMSAQHRLQHWKTVPGWAAFKEVYFEQYRLAVGGERFVEIGSWLGKSACLMAGMISQGEKSIEFTCVDPWTDGGMDLKETEHFRRLGVQHIYDMFLINTEPLKPWINHIREWSPKAAENFDDSTIDFLMIDGDHSYEGVKADIQGWLPKMKPGAVIAGDDYTWPGVKEAVAEFFPGHKSKILVKRTDGNYLLEASFWQVRL